MPLPIIFTLKKTELYFQLSAVMVQLKCFSLRKIDEEGKLHRKIKQLRRMPDRNRNQSLGKVLPLVESHRNLGTTPI
jgi:hypothetical protein